MYDLEVLYGPGRPSGVENRLSVHIAAQLDHLTIVILFHDGHSAERLNPSVRSGGDLDSHESPIARRSELPHSTGRHQPPPVDYRDRVADPLDQLQLVAREHDRNTTGHLL